MRLFGLDIRLNRASETSEDSRTTRQRVHRLEMQLEELVEQIEALKGSHAKLRNQFNGAKGGRPAESERAERSIDKIPVGDKAALRNAVGIRPGVVRSLSN